MMDSIDNDWTLAPPTLQPQHCRHPLLQTLFQRFSCLFLIIATAPGLIFWSVVRNCLKYISLHWNHLPKQLLRLFAQLLSKLFSCSQLHNHQWQCWQPSEQCSQRRVLMVCSCTLLHHWRQGNMRGAGGGGCQACLMANNTALLLVREAFKLEE